MTSRLPYSAHKLSPYFWFGPLTLVSFICIYTAVMMKRGESCFNIKTLSTSPSHGVLGKHYFLNPKWRVLLSGATPGHRPLKDNIKIIWLLQVLNEISWAFCRMTILCSLIHLEKTNTHLSEWSFDNHCWMLYRGLGTSNHIQTRGLKWPSTDFKNVLIGFCLRDATEVILVFQNLDSAGSLLFFF